MSRSDLREFLRQRSKNLTPEREELLAAVMNGGRHMSTLTVVFHSAIADRLGLNPSDHKCADLICNETGPITAGHLAEITGLSTGAITGVVDRLERAGFVSRGPDPQDRRRVVITGTAKRMPDMRHLFLPMIEGMAKVCDSYTDEQLSLIVDHLRKCAEVTEACIQHLQQSVIEPVLVAPETPKEASKSTKKTASARKR